MVEIKSVKVDNWGVFFLQKLQNFFNKTDYCDLTLQFQDNSQLKVHRLVLSACTDFFNILEQQCEVNDDILIMPRDLQADVVVPIVNFMYTGTLEFEVNMYGRLLKTARDMSMTVLLKLLEAHKRTVELPKAAPPKPHPVLLNKAPTGGRQTYAKQSYTQGIAPSLASPQRSYTTQRKPALKVKQTPEKAAQSQPSVSYIRKTLPEPVQLVARYANTATATQKGPSRFDCSDDSSLPEHFDSSFDNISYESKPLITASQIKEEKDLEDDEPSTSSSFEQLRKGYTGPNKRPLSSPSYGASPPEKKPNLKDIMEYTEAERIRKEIVAAEEFEGTEYVEDNFSNDDDSGGNTEQFKATKADTQIAIKEEPGNVNHAQIIHEVLKKYPHLVKNNKNIKLKILQKGGASQSTSATVPVPTRMQANIATQPAQALPVHLTPPPPPPPAAPKPTIVAQKLTPVTSTKSYAVKAAATAATATLTPVTSGGGAAALPMTPQPPKKIDSKTMHTLIAKGAENMTGPWLCLKCGVNGRPISIPSYKSFRRHLVNVHRERIDPRICEHCGLKSMRKDELHHHMFMQHQIKPPADVHFPKCLQCTFVAPHNASLNKHREEKHPKPKLNAHHCIYCNKTFSNEILVYAHMRNNHKERACEDGVMDFDEDQDDVEQYIPSSEMIGHVGGGNIVVGSGGGMLVSGSSVVGSGGGSSGGDNKIKIISNISLPTKGIPYVFDAGAHTVSSISGSQLSQHTSNISLESSSEAEGLGTVASGIATSLTVLDTNVVIGGDAHNEYHTQSDADGQEMITNQYIETAMASVHGEYMKKVDASAIADAGLTQFVNEEGSTLELTASQKADLLQQLQEQQNVVMILNDGETYDQSQMLTDDPNILVVYSEASDIDKQPTMSTTATSTSESLLTTTTTTVDPAATTTTDKSGDNNGKRIDDTKTIDDEIKDADTEDDDMDIEPPSVPTAVAESTAEIKIEQHDSDDEEGDAPKKSDAPNVEKKEKPALLSALEGDWSEDENMESEPMDTSTEAEPVAAERPAAKNETNEVTALPLQPKAQYSNRRTKPLDDDAASKEKKTDDNGTTTVGEAEEKTENNPETDEPVADEPCTTTGNGTATVEDKIDDDDTKVKESDPLDSKISKNEIKTLINDWGDDEDDDD